MRFLILLTLFFSPLQLDAKASEGQILSCKEFDFLVEGLERSKVEQSIKFDLLTEFIEATDPECFS
jgi:hypothetical protein